MSFGGFAMTFSIVCLSPELRHGADPDTLTDNLRRIETAWHAVGAPSTRVVLLPSGGLTGGAGFATQAAAAAAVARSLAITLAVSRSGEFRESP